MRPRWYYYLFLLIPLCFSGSIVNAEELAADEAVLADAQAFAEREKLDDPLGYEAIKTLHEQIDDDHSGSIDVTESIGFVNEEMHIDAKNAKKRTEVFHQNEKETDGQITVDELWIRWVLAKEHNWTVREMIDWLQSSVGFSSAQIQLVEEQNLTGKVLPRLAVKELELLKGVGLTNSQDRRRVQLKALDVVLFGFKQAPGRWYWLDAVLVLALTSSCLAFAIQRRMSLRDKARMEEQLSRLADMEKEMKQFETDRISNNSEDSSSNAADDEKNAVIESQGAATNYGAPAGLQPLLRRTYENEMISVQLQKQLTIKEMQEARENLEKLRRTQKSITSQFRSVAQGYGAEDIDHQMLKLKKKIEKVHHSAEDCKRRWLQIESICGFLITGTSTTTAAKSASKIAMVAVPSAAKQQMSTDSVGSASSLTSNTNGTTQQQQHSRQHGANMSGTTYLINATTGQSLKLPPNAKAGGALPSLMLGVPGLLWPALSSSALLTCGNNTTNNTGVQQPLITAAASKSSTTADRTPVRLYPRAFEQPAAANQHQPITSDHQGIACGSGSLLPLRRGYTSDPSFQQQLNGGYRVPSSSTCQRSSPATGNGHVPQYVHRVARPAWLYDPSLSKPPVTLTPVSETVPYSDDVHEHSTNVYNDSATVSEQQTSFYLNSSDPVDLRDHSISTQNLNGVSYNPTGGVNKRISGSEGNLLSTVPPGTAPRRTESELDAGAQPVGKKKGRLRSAFSFRNLRFRPKAKKQQQSTLAASPHPTINTL